MRSNRHMGLMLASATAMLMADSELLANPIGKPYEPKTGRTVPNPDKQSKAEKKRERKNQQRLKLAKIG